MPFQFVNNVDVGPEGPIYISDSSSKFDPDKVNQGILEHDPNGRVLVYAPATRSVRRLLRGL